MTQLPVLRDLVIVLAVSLAVVFALRRAGVPTIAALLLSGVVLGPGSLGLVREHAEHRGRGGDRRGDAAVRDRPEAVAARAGVAARPDRLAGCRWG